ncbi:MAG TPA: hypothetical protein VKE95_12285 [Burkholderiales bacterium]|nr:hypothetical protein [Burkholderiales bacterium]
MRLRTAVLIGAAGVMLAAAGALWWLYASRDALVKRAIEGFGPQLTGVTVKVQRVRLEPVDGKGSITGLEVGNPPGYKSARALALGEMHLAIDYSSLASNVIRVKEISLQGPVITYETGAGGDNLTAIQKHIDAELARLSGPASADRVSGRKFIVDHIYVRDASVRFGDALTLSMPDVHLRDVGKKSNGASAGEVVKTVWGSIAGGATNVASRAGGAIATGAKSVLEGARGLLK